MLRIRVGPWLLVCGGTFLLIQGEALPGEYVLALLLGPPVEDLLVHLPTLLVLNGLNRVLSTELLSEIQKKNCIIRDRKRNSLVFVIFHIFILT